MNGYSGPYSIGINTVNSGASTIGGASMGQRNLISGNSVGVTLNSPGNIVQGNIVGPDFAGNVRTTITNGVGITSTVGVNSLIGGTGTGEGNMIAGVSASGIEIAGMSIPGLSIELIPDKIAILGNSIRDVSAYNLGGIGTTNLGIDNSKFVDTDTNFVPDQFLERGPNINDAGDVDTGSNGKINYPVLKSAQQIDGEMSITYDLDASGSPTNSYRLEFYANEKRSIFGYGPGESFLGAVTVVPGTNQTATIAVSGDYAGKALSATATAIDTGTASGFGSTSEFSQNISIGSQADFDADGASDSIEDAGPNNGDANNDSIQDSTQPTVTSFKNNAGIYFTLVIDGCSDNNSVSSLDINSINHKDNGYAYPFGLSAFTLNCSRGNTADVQIFIHSSALAKNYIPRKFNTASSDFSEVLGANITQATIGNSKALKLSYSITDGGMYDDDGVENGIIVDPIGLATEQEANTPAGQLANTGIATIITTFLAGGIIAIVVYTYLDYRSHKKPLVAADRETGTQDSKTYTYWHHLRVVSIPLARYRLSIAIDKKHNSKSSILG